ncbi:MAG: cell surface protein, partial [Myxococcota bacterium]
RPWIADGPGIDFVIFENAFENAVGSFAEPAEISVSVDGSKYVTFPCDPRGISWPFAQCAGVRPVFSSPLNQISPFDRKRAGGDGFDLRDVGLRFARFIRIRDRSRALESSGIWCEGESAGFDLDAVAIIWGWP